MALISGCPFVVSFWSALRVWRIFFLPSAPLQSFRLFVVIYCKFWLLWIFFWFFVFFFIFVLIFARRKTIKPVQANCLPAPPCHESSHEPCHGPRTVDGLVKMLDALTNGAFWFRFRFHFGGDGGGGIGSVTFLGGMTWLKWKTIFLLMLAPVFDVRSIALVRVLQQRKFVAVSLGGVSGCGSDRCRVAWPDFIFRLGSKSHALAGSEKQNRNLNRKPKRKGNTKNKSNPSPIPIPNTIQNANNSRGCLWVMPLEIAF